MVGKVVAAGLMALAINACGQASTSQGTNGSVGHESAQAIAVQATDITGLTRCSQSGSPDGVVQALRAGGYTAGADRLARSWQDAKANGGQDAYVVAYTASASDCPRIFEIYDDPFYFPQGDWVFNYVVVFSSSSQAQAAYKAGLYAPTPTGSEAQAFGVTMGSSTGLGDNAWTSPGSSNSWNAEWSKGSSFSMFITSYGPLTAGQLAKKVAARM